MADEGWLLPQSSFREKRDRATEGWPVGRTETFGKGRDRLPKAAPQEEQVGRSCESTERERTSQYAKQKQRFSRGDAGSAEGGQF